MHGDDHEQALTFLRIVSLSAEHLDSQTASGEMLVDLADLMLEDKQDSTRAFSQAAPRRFDQVCSLATELKALTLLADILLSIQRKWVSSVADDQILLDDLRKLKNGVREVTFQSSGSNGEEVAVQMEHDSAAYWRLTAALNYRLTRKAIVSSLVELVNCMITALRCQQEVCKSELFVRG